jgi:hypothetical protein
VLGTGERNQDDVSDILHPARPARSAWAAKLDTNPEHGGGVPLLVA